MELVVLGLLAVAFSSVLLCAEDWLDQRRVRAEIAATRAAIAVYDREATP